MNKNKLTLKLAQGLSLTILAAFLGGWPAHANDALSQHSMDILNPVQNQNVRQNTKHSNRKAAAKRLKKDYQQERQHKDAGTGYRGEK